MAEGIICFSVFALLLPSFSSLSARSFLSPLSQWIAITIHGRGCQRLVVCCRFSRVCYANRGKYSSNALSFDVDLS